MFTFVPIPEGFRIYKDKILLCGILSTNQVDQELVKPGGGVVWKEMPRASWNIHWTSPQMSLDDLKAVLSGVPTAT